MRTRLIGAILGVLCASAALAQKVVRPPEPEISIVGGVAQITMKSDGRQPRVEVMIDGQGPYEFVVDSGAGLSLVESSLVEMLNLTTLGESQSGGAGGLPVRSSQMVQWNELRLGEASFRNGPAIASEVREMFADDPSPPVGILGGSLFRQLLITFDYPGQTLRLEGGALPEPDGKTIFPCKFERGLPVVTITIGEKPIDVLIDTGAATCLALAESFKGQVPLAGQPQPVGMARRAGNESVIEEARIAGEITLGEHVIRHARVTFVGPQSIIGHDILKNFAITLDAQNGRARFTRHESSPIELPRRGHSGFAVRISDGAWVVRYVLPGSPAEKAGLKPGEVVRAINGRACGEYARGEIRTLLTTPGPLEVELEGHTAKLVIEPL